MDRPITINFKLTPSQKETILLRASENGFDDITSYVKVVALKTQAFILTTIDQTTSEASVELEFKVTEAQKAKIEENLKASSCADLSSYLVYVALYGVVTSVVEVRSTGNLDTMLQRIAASR